MLLRSLGFTRSGRASAKGIRPILKQLRTLAGFLFFFVASVSARRQKIESPGKLKVPPEFQKFRGGFKTTREDRKLWPEIQIVSRTSRLPPEIRNRNGTIQKFSGKIKVAAENPQRPREIRIFGWRANLSGGDLNSRAKV